LFEVREKGGNGGIKPSCAIGEKKEGFFFLQKGNSRIASSFTPTGKGKKKKSPSMRERRKKGIEGAPPPGREKGLLQFFRGEKKGEKYSRTSTLQKRPLLRTLREKKGEENLERKVANSPSGRKRGNGLELSHAGESKEEKKLASKEDRLSKGLECSTTGRRHVLYSRKAPEKRIRTRSEKGAQ